MSAQSGWAGLRTQLRTDLPGDPRTFFLSGKSAKIPFKRLIRRARK